MAEIQVNAWKNYNYHDKEKGLNIKTISKEEVAKRKLRRKICIIALIVLAVIILVLAIVLAIVFGMPEKEPYSRGKTNQKFQTDFLPS